MNQTANDSEIIDVIHARLMALFIYILRETL